MVWRNGFAEPTTAQDAKQRAPVRRGGQQILEEYQRVAEQVPTVDILPKLELLSINCLFINADDFKTSVCDDPKDEKFIECAIAGNIKTIVSRDKHLLNIALLQMGW